MDKGKPKATSMTPVNLLVDSWTASGTPLSAIATGTSMASIDNAARQTSTPAINSSRDRDTAAQVSICPPVDGHVRTEVPPWSAGAWSAKPYAICCRTRSRPPREIDAGEQVTETTLLLRRKF
jgi:hypothetical protein